MTRCKTNSNKRGFRVIIKCRNVAFDTPRPVNALLNVLQILLNLDSILKLTGKSSIDNVMYLNGYKSLRLPLCCKSAETGEGCLVPILVDSGKAKGQLMFSTFLIHHKPASYCEMFVKVIKQVPTVSIRMIRETTTTENIHRDIYACKFKKKKRTAAR